MMNQTCVEVDTGWIHLIITDNDVGMDVILLKILMMIMSVFDDEDLCKLDYSNRVVFCKPYLD